MRVKKNIDCVHTMKNILAACTMYIFTCLRAAMCTTRPQKIKREELIAIGMIPTCEHWTVKSIAESVSSNGHRPYERNMISLISPMGDFDREHIVLDAVSQYVSFKIQFDRSGFSLTSSTQHCDDWWMHE